MTDYSPFGPTVFDGPLTGAIPPLPPRPTTVPIGNDIYVPDGSSYSVATGTQVYSNQGFAFRAWGPVTNDGLIWSEATTSSIGVCLDGGTGALTNRGTIVSTSTFGDSQAVVVPNAPNTGSITNNGSLYALSAAGNAYGIEVSLPVQSVLNNGLIAVQAHTNPAEPYDPWWPHWTGKAYGIKNGWGNIPVVNGINGRILVEGDWPVGIWSRGSLTSTPGVYDVSNAGQITVASTVAGQPSYGLLLANTSTFMRVLNSGTITADVAIYAPSSGNDGEYGDIFDNPQIVTNTSTGLINGDILLRNGNDSFLNSGVVHGHVDMGPGNDVIDTSAGTIDGLVLLGMGDDRYAGSVGTDVAAGDSGNDWLDGGGGNDLLLGDSGDDVVIGGLGNDGLYGGYGNDRLVLVGGDRAAGGPGDDRFELSDYTSSQIDGGAGFDTLVLPGGSRVIDLRMLAASGRVTSIEQIVLGGSKELIVRPGDVAAITSGGSELTVDSDAGDRIDLVGSWTELTGRMVNGASFRVFSDGAARILVEQSAVVQIMVAPPVSGSGFDAIAAGAVAPHAGADIGLMPDEDAHEVYDSINLNNQQFVTQPYSTWTNFGGSAIFYSDEQDGYDPARTSLTNYATLSVTSVLRTTQTIGLFSGDLDNHGTITATNTAAGLARTVFILHDGLVYNSGEISAYADQGDAIGVSTYGAVTDAPVVFNQATGTINAFSYSGYAIGVRIANGFTGIDNAGVISVDGGNGSSAIYFASNHNSVLNTGTIVATAPVSSPNYAIALDIYDFGDVTNHGTISGDLSVLIRARYGFQSVVHNDGHIYGTILVNPFSPNAVPVLDSGALEIDNSGSIAGDIIVSPLVLAKTVMANWNGQVAFFNDLIINNGLIDGSVSLGQGADIYDGRGGTVTGTVNGGVGGDTLFGGNSIDRLTGGEGADLLRGGGADDYFIDTAGGHNGDTIADLSYGDHLIFTDVDPTTFTYSLSGNTLNYSGGSLTLTQHSGQLIISSAAGGAVELSLTLAAPRFNNDFNGDGRSDILWRSDTGSFSDWLGKSNGGFAANDANALSSVPTSWKVAGTGDFNGDGRADVLWRNSTGQVSDWLGKADGGFTVNDANAASQVPTSWKVVGTGDFNGDGRSDVLWRNDSGALSDWLGQANGGFAVNDANAARQVPTTWKVVGTGDFNGDGRSDILWRNDSGQLSNWLGQANGGFAANDANAFTQVPTTWKVVGVGDFNGDGRSDVLWRNDNGALSDWLGQANGGFTANDANAYSSVPTSWHVADVGDYNGDGRDDILWRNSSGALSDWLGQTNGGFVGNDVNAFTSVPTTWLVQSPDSFYL